ncbi:NAD(P)/FAD-dependent oxidoreductase [Ancylobacter sonchi]|uniref:NAD(P)/FAD-dependent oxidoreductase n=1 Tax=Ancylobacter sonchi TaxID=1937790 RepID=UPI001BD4FDD9|nr:NAD(P)/FAD-dependent oxidoreductase [Ancylobacter sonchi]
MCAIEAARRGRRTLVIDHARAPGEKIRISGGGRCNFTNIGTSPKNFLSANPGFCISALKRYSQQDFIALVRRHGIAFHEKTLGQLFCDGSARQIVDLLLRELHDAGGELRLATTAALPERADSGFRLATSSGALACDSLVVATGGKSIPKMGATGFGYDIAERFGLPMTPTRPALVPLTLDPALLERLAPLAGVGLPARAGHGKTRFDEAILFTHRGLSGPAVLQISSYWREGDEIALDLAPGTDVFAALRAARAENGRQAPASALAALLPRRLAQLVADTHAAGRNLADLSDKALRQLALAVNEWRFKPTGSEGYRTAEVTLGGVDTAGLDQKTMQAKAVPGLFFIGEVVDVTGWLGGYNFQWAWSSGWAAGQAA